MAHFYLLETLESTIVGSMVTLDGAEGKHAATVSRVRVGEMLAIGNGRGLMLDVEAVTVAKDRVDLVVLAVEQLLPAAPRLTLVQALAKTDRDERAIESATELGVDVVIPWAAARSVSKWEGAKVEKGIARWSSIVREATKQSIRSFLPVVTKPLTSKELITALANQQVFVLDPTGTDLLSSVALSGKDITFVVGPEGGITESELDAFAAVGAHIVSLGENILRTSTAGPAAIAILNAKLGRS